MNQQLNTMSFSEIVSALLARISEREADVLRKRNALENTEKYTLEEIGKEYNVTRERVRQIENEGIRKIRSIQYEKEKIPVQAIAEQIASILLSHGGAMSEDHLLERLMDERDTATEHAAINFIMEYILAEQFSREQPAGEFNPIWKIGGMSVATYLEIANHLHRIIVKQNRPITIDDLVSEIREHDLFDYIDKNSARNDAMIEALLRLRTDINKNILNEWGLKTWKSVVPKRMTDKAYLILKREGRPLHFEEITDLINQACFDNKKACAATVHNELILDDKYVLVGRGLYGLKEHGYSEGTVTELIEKLLKERGTMSKQDIIDEILRQRKVQKTTITLALMKKERFSKQADGTYICVKA